MTEQQQKNVVVVHDVLGTLFSLSSPIKTLQDIFGPQLQDYPPNFAELIVMVSLPPFCLVSPHAKGKSTE